MNLTQLISNWDVAKGVQPLLTELGADWGALELMCEAAPLPLVSEAMLFAEDASESGVNAVAKRLAEQYTFLESSRRLNISEATHAMYEGIEKEGSSPKYVIFEMPSGFSKVLDEETIKNPDKAPTKATRNRFWPEEVIHDFAEQIRSRKPVGYMGHASFMDFSTVPENIPVKWETAIKARRKSDGVGVTLARGYVYDTGMNRAYIDTGAIANASVNTVGRMEQDTTDKSNPFPKVVSAGLLSFDFVRKDTHGIPGTKMVASVEVQSKEACRMELTPEQVALLATLNAEQLKQYNPSLAQELSKTTPDSDYAALAEQLKGEILKGVELARNAAIAKQCATEMGCEVSTLPTVISDIRKRGDALVETAIVTLTETINSKALRERVRGDLRNKKLTDPKMVEGLLAEILQGYRDLINELGEGLELDSIGALVAEGLNANNGNDLVAAEWRA